MQNKLVFLATIIMIGAVIYAVFPLFGKSYIPTHDGEYHIIRIVEFSKMLSTGYIFPRWAPDMNSGYGIPIFNYHYPLPNYIGSLARVFTRDAVYAFQGSMGLGYIALAIAAYLWLSALFGTVPGLMGSTIAVFVPYLFVDTYVRGTIGEVWATAFLLLCFYLLEKKRFMWFAVSFALLILSHNIMAMLFTPFILGYALIRNKKAILWMLGGLGLSAFFWIPALFESQYVVGLNTVNFREHFVQVYELLVPSWGTEFSVSGAFGNQMSFQIGVVPILTIIGASLILRRERRHEIRQLFYYFTIVLAACIVFMLPLSEKIWEVVTPLQLMQYPWRLLSFVIPIAGFCAALWAASMKKKWWAILLPILAVAVAASYARPVLYAPRNEAYYLSRPNFTDGTSSMGNSFSTIWTGWKSEEGTSSGILKLNIFHQTARVTYSSESSVAVHTIYFPGWKAYIDNHEVPIINRDGIIHITVPAGSHTVQVYFGETPVRLFADGVSVASLVILIVSGILAL